jgi:diguanylate cyclase (GGDEF)-like protein
MEVRGFDDIDAAATAVLAMLRKRLRRDCGLFDVSEFDRNAIDSDLMVDLVHGGGMPHATMVVSRGDAPLSAADRELVELSARLLTTLVDAARELGVASAEAETDPLTGLANRRGWERRMKNIELKGGFDRLPVVNPVVLSVIDIEGLKDINDRQGYAAGDDLLKCAATALGEACKPGLVARIGGDEFAVWSVFDHGQSIDETASNLRSALAAVGVSAAIGSARHDGSRSTEETYAEADRRMVAEKRRKRSG